jgi:prevent-host-death family protein
MDKTYSIAEARNDLSNVVREAEAGRPVTLSRRGRPVAVVVSTAQARMPLSEAVDAFRKENLGSLDNAEWVQTRSVLVEEGHREHVVQAIVELRRFRETCHTGKGNVDLREMIEAGRR